MYNNQTITTIPLENNKSSVVWILNKDKAKKLQNNTPFINNNTLHILRSFLGNRLGEINIYSKNQQQFTLHSKMIKNFYKNNVIFLGEAIHTTLPIAAQGFNLCLGDIQALIKSIHKIQNNQLHIDKLGDDYQKQRYKTVLKTVWGIHGLSSVLFNDTLSPEGIMRRLTMKLITASPSLKNALCLSVSIIAIVKKKTKKIYA